MSKTIYWNNWLAIRKYYLERPFEPFFKVKIHKLVQGFKHIDLYFGTANYTLTFIIKW